MSQKGVPQRQYRVIGKNVYLWDTNNLYVEDDEDVPSRSLYLIAPGGLIAIAP